MAKTQLAPVLLMPKATAVWLFENTTLTFAQIAEFTQLDPLEVQALADGDVGRGIVGRDPISHKELTQEELDKAQADETYKMTASKSDLPAVKMRSKGPKYTPVSKRGDKPDAIAWIIKHNPEITDAQICRLIGTTKPTIKAVRERTHANIVNIKPRHPADLGLCSYMELEAASEKGLRAQGKDPEAVKAARNQQMAQEQAPEEQEPSGAMAGMAGFDFSNFLSNTSGPSPEQSSESQDRFQTDTSENKEFEDKFGS